MQHGSLAQLGEHLPYKQRVIGSSPIVSTTFQGESLASNGLVVQFVRTPPCHGGVAQSVEQRTENPRGVGSIPTGGTIRNAIAFLI